MEDRMRLMGRSVFVVGQRPIGPEIVRFKHARHCAHWDRLKSGHCWLQVRKYTGQSKRYDPDLFLSKVEPVRTVSSWTLDTTNKAQFEAYKDHAASFMTNCSPLSSS